MKTIAFFNNKGGVGKTTLVYHLAWMYADLGLSVLAADLDPQANLTAMFLDEDRLEQLWPVDGDHRQSIIGAFQPILSGTGDLASPHVEHVSERLGLVVGDLGLSRLEGILAQAWPNSMDRQEPAFRQLSAFYRLLVDAANQRSADIVLMDVGPNLGAINRAAMIASEHVAIPLAPDLYSLQGLRNLGPALREWRSEWRERLTKRPSAALVLPNGEMAPIGYIIMQHAVRAGRPARAYERWTARVPAEYRSSVLGISDPSKVPAWTVDGYCLSLMKHYRSLMPMAMEAHKPMFFLKPADGAIGAHTAAVSACYEDFKQLAIRIAENCGVALSV
ncbi:MAG: AAA family ATPase [candidate division WOR-3 bacterium]|nr:AAA family ATPase [candidate division WOR-3 bacterium]